MTEGHGFKSHLELAFFSRVDVISMFNISYNTHFGDILYPVDFVMNYELSMPMLLSVIKCTVVMSILYQLFVIHLIF